MLPYKIPFRSVELLQRYGDLRRNRDFSILQDVWTTHKEHMVVSISVQNLVEIGAVVLMIRNFRLLLVWLENAYSGPQNWGFWGI